MSEAVEKHMEAMVDEIEEMRRTKLFTAEETKYIIKSRKSHEYKVNGVTKDVQDFKDYIQFERLLLKDIKLRRMKFRVADGKSSLEYKILKRVKNLYEIALQRYSSDFSLSLSYFKFCKDSNYHKPATLIIQNMMKNFSYLPEVWQIASAWYVKSDINQALNVIHKGIMIHRHCPELYKEAIRMELLNTGNAEWSKESQKSKDEICCEKIMAYIASIFKNILGFEFLMEVLKQLEPHNSTKKAQNLIIKKLMDDYSHEELVWHMLAQREKKGFHYDIADEDILKSTKFCLNRSFQKYEEGLSKVPQSRKSALWTLYLDFLVELQHESDVATVLRRDKLFSALEQASNQISLAEKYYIVWAELTTGEEETVKVIEKGLEAIPDSVALWQLRLKVAAMKDHVKEVNKVFEMGILKLKEKSAPLWMSVIRYHNLTSGSEVLDLIYKNAIKQPKEVSDLLKPQYIEWLALVKGLREARKTYNIIAREKPYCKELHVAMFKVESLEMEQDIDEMENVLHLAWEQFGHQEVDVSINYMQFYLRYHKKLVDVNPSFQVNEKVMEIYRESENKLKQSNDPLLLSKLREKYDVIKSITNI